MLPTSSIVPRRLRLAALLSSTLICVSVLDCAAQSERRPKTSAMPRVGTIKDYPATGLMTGCGNLYVYRAAKVLPTDASYVFLAHGDGSNAWMNLGGRDVRLQQLKLVTRKGRKVWRYRFGGLSISVVTDNFKPESETVEEGDSMFKVTITLRRGRALRIVRAVGDSDC